MKIFMATLATETNTFSPLPTGHAAFTGGREWYRHDASRQPPTIANIPLIAWRRLGEADGHEVAESLCTFAQPAGTTLRHVYEELRDTLLDDLRAAMPVDVVLLFMHGAMVAHGYDDCEGDTLARVRAVVGPRATIGLELDLHCHLTEQMRTSADAIVLYKEYPHVDIGDRAPELYRICLDAAAGAVRPVMAFHDCRMVGTYRPTQQPVRGFVDRIKALEGHDGILSVSFGHGFPWADVADVGTRMLVIADGDPAKAAALARRLGEELWAMRDEATARLDSIDDGLDLVVAGGDGGPVVLADASDNAGGGAPSDNTAILRRVLERGITGAVLGCFWDPQAVQFCAEAGEGATFLLRVGGKCGPASGDPVDLVATVRRVAENHSQAGLSGGRSGLGRSVWVSGDGIDLVLVTMRQQTFAPDAFTGLGITLHDKAVVVVKSSQHFQAGFAPDGARDPLRLGAGRAELRLRGTPVHQAHRRRSGRASPTRSHSRPDEKQAQETESTMTLLTRRATLGALAAAALARPSLAQGTAGTLRFVPQSDLSALDPIWTTGYVVRNHGYMVFDTLYATDAAFQVQPQMAEGHEVADDGRTWTIRLRDGLVSMTARRCWRGTAWPASGAGPRATASASR